MVGSFPVMRPGMVAVIADSPERVERVNEIVQALGQFGLPAVRHVASPATTPGYVLQLVAQFEASFARLAFVAVGESDCCGRCSTLRRRRRCSTDAHRRDAARDAVRQALRLGRHGAVRTRRC